MAPEPAEDKAHEATRHTSTFWHQEICVNQPAEDPESGHANQNRQNMKMVAEAMKSSYGYPNSE
jgi:hypothetical protein